MSAPYAGEPKGAYRPAEFMIRYAIGRTSFYAEVKAKRLTLRKRGTASIVLHDEAERWANSLPMVGDEQVRHASERATPTPERSAA
jgi:hypothetical protein